MKSPVPKCFASSTFGTPPLKGGMRQILLSKEVPRNSLSRFFGKVED